MTTYVPKYYNKFRCIASSCKHNCCIGWEIDIDNDTMEKYRNLRGSFGELLRKNICISEESTGDINTFCFKLDKNDRCPFLNNDNLCDIQNELSEKYLCQICRDHPRFRNFYDDKIEMGLGLSCEEAARIILTASLNESLTLVEETNDTRDTKDTKDTKSTSESTSESKTISLIDSSCSARDIALRIIKDNDEELNEKGFKTIVDSLISEFNIPNINVPTSDSASYTSLCDWISGLCKLDILYSEWKDILLDFKENLQKSEPDISIYEYVEAYLSSSSARFKSALRNLLIYFIYRNCEYGEDQEIGFALFSTLIILSICINASDSQLNGLDLEYIADISRMYSSEIEYSENNRQEIMSCC